MIVIFLAGLVLLFLPQVWAKRIMAKNSYERNDIPGSGEQFAQHLITNLKLTDCKILEDQKNLGDHYDPESKSVVLSKGNFNSKSLTAIVVAGHEIGHAYQDHIGFKPLKLRTSLVRWAAKAEKLASIILLASPIIVFLTKMPIIGGIVFLSAFGVMALPVLVHLLTLPTELDASFKRALPILSAGYIKKEDIKVAKQILLACSLTYLAASLAGLLNLWRWIRLLRR
tara:strand:- start:705 stop:1385 length:681 start_codon:yes stop_codon:yes gene_type:complete